MTDVERDKLLLTVAADLAQRRRERGLKLNYPESVAILSCYVLEGARDGKTVAELMDGGRSVLTRDDVMDGIAEMLDGRILSIHENEIGPGHERSLTVAQHLEQAQ